MEETLNEEWRDIKGFEGRYQINKDGKVKSLSHKVVRYTKDIILKKDIADYVTLKDGEKLKSEYIYKLLIEAFPEIYNKE